MASKKKSTKTVKQMVAAIKASPNKDAKKSGKKKAAKRLDLGDLTPAVSVVRRAQEQLATIARGFSKPGVMKSENPFKKARKKKAPKTAKVGRRKRRKSTK